MKNNEIEQLKLQNREIKSYLDVVLKGFYIIFGGFVGVYLGLLQVFSFACFWMFCVLAFTIIVFRRSWKNLKEKNGK